MIHPSNLKTAWHLLHRFGPRWVAERTLYLLKKRSGLFERRFPATTWEAVPLADQLGDAALADPDRYLEYRRRHPSQFFFSPRQRDEFAPLLEAFRDEQAGESTAQRLRRGEMTFFGGSVRHVGFPPRWNVNPTTGRSLPARTHWSRIGDFGHGDIKEVWEPSRFGFVYALVRDDWRTGTDEGAELFWQLVESWRAENPPQQGPNWKCGQEAAIRLTAWCFGLYGFMDSPSTTPQRVALLAQMIAAGAERIAANIGYAISQMNNHPMSEAAGLWTAGLLFPEFKNAPRWKARGRAILTTLARRLIYDDGAFSQHSMNYHRVMLHVYLWAIRLGELNDAPLDPETTGRIGRAADLLFQLQDESSGRVPHCGADDGALILPLSDCEYHDFRPVVQATRRCVYGCNTYGPGPWDEDLLWLFGPARDDVPVRAPVRRDWAAEEGGYHTLRAADGFAFLRCGAFRHRPSQADMLHVDLWWRGQNIAIDAGTFSYNAPAPWDGAFSRTAVHNTVSVDGADQMPRVSRFLMLPWLTAKVTARATGPAGHLAWLECRHDGYQRLDPPVTHARAICRIGDAHWLVVDRLTSRREHDFRLHWLLRDVPYRWDADARLVALETPAGVYSLRYGILDGSSAVSLVRAQPDGTRGWYAPFYASKQPALSLELTSRSNVARMWTLLGPGGCDMVADAEGWTLTEDRWRATVVLHEGPDGPIFRSAAWTSADGATDRIADTSGGVRPGDSPAGAQRPPDSR